MTRESKETISTPLILETRRPEQTEALGAALAAMLPPGTVVALFGDLATGKTCLTRGMTKYLVRNAGTHSPTFTLVNQYGEDPPVFHLDLYRLSNPSELADLGYEEWFDSSGLCIVEWAERAESLLPSPCIRIHLEHGGGDTRRLEIQAAGLLPKGWEDRLRQAIGVLK